MDGRYNFLTAGPMRRPSRRATAPKGPIVSQISAYEDALKGIGRTPYLTTGIGITRA